MAILLRAGDGPLTHDEVAVVEDGRLARRHAVCRLVEPQAALLDQETHDPAAEESKAPFRRQE